MEDVMQGLKHVMHNRPSPLGARPPFSWHAATQAVVLFAAFLFVAVLVCGGI
jgi:hypothetical protein